MYDFLEVTTTYKPTTSYIPESTTAPKPGIYIFHCIENIHLGLRILGDCRDKNYECDVFISVLCNCAVPGNGTGYHSNMIICEDGLVEYCPGYQECSATEFFEYQNIKDACKLIGDSSKP